MRHGLARLVLAGVALWSFGLAAEVVILKDGRTYSLARPVTVKGGQAILNLSDGRLLSVRTSEIDAQKTAAANAATPPKAAAPTPVATPSGSIADAVKAAPKRKATIIITDADVASGLAPGADAGTPQEGKVEVVGVTSSKGGGGYSVSAQVVNSGEGDAKGITVAVEAVGEKNATVGSTFATLAKTDLASGERTALQATITTNKNVVNFRFIPKWRVEVPVKPAATAEQEAAEAKRREKGTGTASETEARPEATPPPKASEQPKEAPTPAPQPDMAAPVANAPVGSPSTPGGTYVPRPSAPSSQPKLPDQPK